MNLSQLYYFRKLAELQHYTKTAKEFYITQPSLSDSIAALEKELGVALFQKDGRNVKLTKYGFLPNATNHYLEKNLWQNLMSTMECPLKWQGVWPPENYNL